MSDHSAVFLSYASEDVAAAERIATALRDAGIEVWFDKNELVGGDAWDAKIRGQIQSCTLFLPVISANTQARAEGYFRLEWKLAADRTHLMADDHAFLFPIVIDETGDAEARVPERFRERQWMRLESTSPAAIASRLAQVLSGAPVASFQQGASPRAAQPAAPASSQSSPSNRTKWLWIGVPAAVIPLAFAFWLVIDRFYDPLDLESGEVTEPVESISEATRLAARANELVIADSLSRADLETAFELCEQAAAMEPLNAEVWATWSRVCAAQVFYRFDNTTENTVRAEDFAAKAVRLNPESIEARFAQVNYWLTVAGSLNGFNPELFRQAFEMLEQMHAESPDDPRILQSLGGILASIPETRERGMQMIDKLTTIPGWKERGWNGYGWMQFFSGKYDLAQEAATKGLTEKNHPPILVLNTMLAMHWSGDLDAALAFLNRLSPATQREDWLLALRVRLLMWRGEPAGILQRLNQHPRDWIDSQIFDGPKSWWIGEANRKLDRPMAAEQSYQTALRLIDARLSDAPQDPNLLSLKIWVLHRLGQQEESRKVYDLMVENQWDWFGVHALFEPEKILAEFETTFDHPDFWRTAAALRHLEWFEPIRDTPEFQDLLARAEASSRHNPNPTTGISNSMSEIAVPAKSIAVLAFANRSADADNEYFSDGISEELLNVLTKVEGLKVTARTSAFHFKGKDTPIREIGRQLGVAYIVEGSVRRVGNRVRITTQLIKAEDGFNVWSESFDRDLKDIFALQDEIAGLVAKELQLKLGITSPSREVNPEAYGLFLQARELWNQRGEDNFIRAEAALNRALELDPDFAEAHATMADIWAMRATYWSYQGKADTSEEIAKTRASANHALSLNPDLSRPYSALGWACMLEGKWEESRRWHRQAIERSPRDAMTRFWYGSLLAQIGEIEASERELQFAAELDPLSFIITLNLGFYGYIREDWQESYDYYRKGAQLREGGFIPALSGMANSAYGLGRTEEAVRLSREVLSSWPELPRFSSDQFAVWVLHNTGHETEAEAFVESVMPELPPNSYIRGFLLAAIGRWEEALPNFETTPYAARGWVFDSPILDPWRDDPRFLAMIDRWGETERYQQFRAALLDYREK
ncbi:MAG: hypothetical protein SynsKO_28350 [Synoicihabitans sp.]